jgi:hypothetical protein
MQVTRLGLMAAVAMIDKNISKELEPYWATVRTFLDELPDHVLIELLQSISKQLVADKQCLIIQEGEDLRVVKDIQTFLFKD